MKNPYKAQPKKAFWKLAVTGRHFTELEGFSGVPEDIATARIATAGSCFAQHIGWNLRKFGLNYMDYEPAPSFLKPEAAAMFGYNIYSCRYGNIYTVRQLVQLFDEAQGARQPKDWIWSKETNGQVRYFDALRPGVFTNGFADEQEVRTMRAAHLNRVQAMFSDLDILVFTLGLTEHWRSSEDGTAFPMAPGVIAGHYDPSKYKFHNSGFREVLSDMEAFRERLKLINSRARILLTVSPVPLAATATDDHVLVATTYSKSVLRAVAGEMACAHDDVSYFPSYEIITGQPARHFYYGADMREVAPEGVQQVMKHFFRGIDLPQANKKNAVELKDDKLGFEQCEEALLSNEYHC